MINVTSVVPSKAVIEKFVKNYYNGIDEQTKNLVVDKIYDKCLGKNVTMSSQIKSAYDNFQLLYRRMATYELANQTNSLVQHFKAVYDKCKTNKPYAYPFGGVTELLAQMQADDRSYLDKEFIIKAYVTELYNNDRNLNTINGRMLKVSVLNAKIEKATNAILRFVIAAEKGVGRKTSLNMEEEYVYDRVMPLVNKQLQENSYNSNKIMQESAFISQAMGINNYIPKPQMMENMYRVNLDLTELSENNINVDEIRENINLLMQFISRKVKGDNFVKSAYKLELIGGNENEWTPSTLKVAKSNHADESQRLVEQFINTLYTYNLANLNLNVSEGDFKKNLKEYIAKDVNLTNGADKYTLLKASKTSNKYKESTELRALINTLNMSKFFLGKDALKVVEKELTSKICDGLACLNSSAIEKFSYYYDTITDLVRNTPKDNFHRINNELQNLCDICLKDVVSKFTTEERTKLQSMVKVVETLQAIAIKKYEDDKFDLATKAINSTVPVSIVELAKQESELNSIVTLSLIKNVIADGNEFHKSIVYLMKDKKMDFEEIPNFKKVKKSEYRNVLFNWFKSIYTSKGYNFENEVDDLMDFTITKQTSENNKSELVKAKTSINKLIEGKLFNKQELDSHIIEFLNNRLAQNDNILSPVFNYLDLEKVSSKYNANGLITDENLDLLMEIANDEANISNQIDINSNKLSVVLDMLNNKLLELDEKMENTVCASKNDVAEFAHMKHTAICLCDMLQGLKECELVIDPARYEEFRRNCKTSLGLRLNSAIAYSVGSSKEGYARKTNPDLIYKNFPEIKEEDRKKYNNFIANMSRYWSIYSGNKSMVNDEGRYFTIINYLSDFVTNLNELILKKIESSQEGRKEILYCGAKKDYDKLEKLARDVVAKFVEKEYGKTFKSSAQATDYYIDSVILTVAQAYEIALQQKDEKLRRRAIMDIGSKVLPEIKKNFAEFELYSDEKEVEIEEAVAELEAVAVEG